jgi:hypothetical protein
MSTTPRTDEQVLAYRAEDGSEMVHASFAAELEIELASAKKDLVIAYDGLDERDRLRDEVENLKTDLFLALRQVNIPAGFWGRAASRYKARAEKAEAELAKAKATIEDICTGGRLTCDQCLETMPCNCGHSARRL